MIRRVVIRHFRNINEVVLTELGSVNVFVGANGAGKTALLEALFTLAHGKSFRRFGGQKESLVQFSQQELTVVAYERVRSDDGEIAWHPNSPDKSGVSVE